MAKRYWSHFAIRPFLATRSWRPAAHRDLVETTDAEWLAMGQIARQASRVIRENNPEIEKCYLVSIGDVDLGHLHFHILPKGKEDPSLGPFIFGDEGWLNSQRK